MAQTSLSRLAHSTTRLPARLFGAYLPRLVAQNDVQ
jgi:hypothetical protein